MLSTDWKLLSFLIAFSAIIVSSNGSDENTKEDVMKLAEANNDLAIELYNQFMKDTDGNVFFSPLSISDAFGMLFAGARGDSAKQLRSVLGYDSANLPSSQVPSAFNQYLSKVLSKHQSKDPDYALNLANEILLSKNYKVKSSYKNEVQNLFHANIKNVDFMKNTNQILKNVNNFVSKQTNGKIDKFLNNLNPSTVMLLINAIYFYGNWKHPFRKESTHNQTFYNHGSESNTKKVPFMHQEGTFSYLSLNNMHALEFPYKGDNISMVFLLPDQQDGLSSLEDNITPEKILKVLKKMDRMFIRVALPKFKIDYKHKLNPVFKALGATDIFDSGKADLSGITSSNNLYVSQSMHKAAISVDEKGSEAAAASEIALGPGGARYPPPSFTADHPFMFAIIDKRNDMMLFLGRVTEL